MGGRGWVVEEEVERRKIMIGQAWVRHGSAEVWADSSPEPPAVWGRTAPSRKHELLCLLAYIVAQPLQRKSRHRTPGWQHNVSSQLGL